jgi:hypothetical protein
MANHRIDEETRNVLIASVAVWGSIIATAVVEDLFGKFDARSAAYFAVAVSVYALAVYRLDRNLHAFIVGLSRGPIVTAACLTVATLTAASLAHVPALAVFLAPLATVASVAAFEKLTARPTKVPAKSPAGTRAAT